MRLRKYGVEATIDFSLYEVDGVDLRDDWTPAAADCEVQKDGANFVQCTNTASQEDGTYSIVLTATEMQAARIVLKVVDAATKVFLDISVIIETYGNASAQHAFDFDTASVAQGADNNTILSSLTIANGAVDAKITYIMDTILTETAGGRLAAAFIKLFDVVTPLLVASDVMRGTNDAALAATALTDATWTDAAAQALLDWVNGGRLDLLLDTIRDELANGTDGLSALKTLIDAVKAETALIVEDTNELQTDGIAALITELNNLSAANVNAEIVDALATDTYAEPGDEAPGATISLSDKINYIYKFLRNKIETTQTRIHVYNDAGDNKDHSSIIADNGTTTFTRGEFGAGDA